MKKIFMLLLGVCLIFALSACNGGPATDSIGSEQVTNDTENTTGPSITDTNITPTTQSPSEDSITSPTTCLHDWSDATCTTPKTCSTCGSTEGDAAGHKWNDATCIAPKTCSVCKTTEGSSKGHEWNNATCTTPKTCSTCGSTEGDAAGHKWSDATCTTPQTCFTCDATKGGLADHNWQDATCTTPCICSNCGMPDTYAPVDNHKWQEATCTMPKTCSKCGATDGSVKDHSIFAECIRGEYRLYQYCTYECGYSEYIDLDPLNIAFTNTGYLGYSVHGHCVDNPNFEIQVTGGYLSGRYGDWYTFECYRENGNLFPCTVRHWDNPNKLYVDVGGYWYVDEVITIVISDNYGHSHTKKITFIVDPSNEHKLLFKEI